MPPNTAPPEQLLIYPAGHRALTATNPTSFADAVTTLLEHWPSIAYHPKGGWPWTWPDSHLTDWICAFDHGSLAGLAVLL